jgi:DNA-directed RNA polymerase sigma subunit (sigma70/sigma32)
MEEEYELLKDFMQRLPDKERIALELYYPANPDDKKTFEEIGQALGGMSKVGARQVVNRAFAKLKEFAKEYGY